MAASLDGKIASYPLENDVARRASQFSSDADKEFVRSQIKTADAIITGANSMRASSGAWEQKGRQDRYPIWVVFSNHGLAPDLRFFKQTHIPRWIVSQKPLVRQKNTGVEYLAYEDAKPAAFVMQHLQAQGVERVLLFGGGFINQLFYQEGLVDELKLTVCPKIIGTNEAPEFITPGLSCPVSLSLLSVQQTGDHVFLHYSIKKI